MQLFGLQPPAQIILLQGLSTYTALGSAYFFARPVLRVQEAQFRLDLIENLTAKDPETGALIDTATEILQSKLLRNQPLTRRDNRRGIACLAGSFLLFSAALAIQVATEPTIWPSGPATTTKP